MDRLEKLVNILKLTPHRQPELVKEAAHRILQRSLRTDLQIHYLLKPLLEILILYCDTDDSAQRSLFNDYLNSVILAFQNQNYNLILRVLVEELANNGSARSLTAALLRIPHLISNVQPVELGCDPQNLLKTFIEISRRSEDESVQKALEATLKRMMPYLDYYVRKSREMQFLLNSLVDVLLRNLHHDSTQIKRLAASSISIICANSELQFLNTSNKLSEQLDNLSQAESKSLDSSRYIGLCLCVRELPDFASCHQKTIMKLLLNHIEANTENISTIVCSLETVKELIANHEIDLQILHKLAHVLVENFLIEKKDGIETIRSDPKVILQSNALACISTIIKQQPQILDSLQIIFQFKDHPDVAVRNQLIYIIGNYIEAVWRFPRCIDRTIDCEKIRKLWIELRTLMYDETIHPDSLKSCVTSIKVCLNTLLESDHCLHIIEYQDFDRLIQLYFKSSFKPFRVETLNLFANLNYRTLYYLERHHWSKLRSHAASSLIDSLQDRIVNDVIIASLTDDHQKIRNAATNALISIVPKLYITSISNGSRVNMSRSSDPIVSLASDLVDEHLVVLKQADEHMSLLFDRDESMVSSEYHDSIGMKIRHTSLTSSIIPPHGETCHDASHSTYFKASSENTSTNLMYIVSLLKTNLDNSLYKGKNAMSSIVRSLHELAKSYPITQYSASWDCRPSEYCDCFTLVNFILTYLENLTEPDVVIEDLEAYRVFLSLAQHLIYALCHESVSNDYESQRVKPYHTRVANTREGDWSELTIKPTCLDDIYQAYFKHLVKLLWLTSYVVEEKSNPFATSSKSSLNQQQQQKNPQLKDSVANHEILTSNRLFFCRVHKKLELSYKSSKKNLRQQDEKFYQILETCLSNISSLLEFMSLRKSMEYVHEILAYLKTTSSILPVPSLECARQLLKSLFGVNIIAIYQVDPHDWFNQELASSTMQLASSLMSSQENQCPALQGVYHRLISKPYKVFSNYHTMNCSQITPISDKTLAIFNFESRRALKVRRRIEERVKSLFEINPNQMVSPKLKEISEMLKSIIAEFSPIVTDCMSQFNAMGFCQYQGEVLHFMSYLLLLRVNYQKLPLANTFIETIYKLLDSCGEKMFTNREYFIGFLLRSSFTFLSLLTYERGPSKPMFQVATVIEKLDDLRAKLDMASAKRIDVTTYVIPLLRCLVDDLFIYRTEHFQNTPPIGGNILHSIRNIDQETNTIDTTESRKDTFEILEAERETVAKKLLDIIDNPGIHDLLSILILESRQNSDEIKYKKLSQHLLPIIECKLSQRSLNMTNYRRIELIRRIIENISPEVFQPINFIFKTLLNDSKPSYVEIKVGDVDVEQDFQRWMSLVIITIHILTRQVEEEKFLTRIRESMTDENFVGYLLQIAQHCVAELLIRLKSPVVDLRNSNLEFLMQQLSSYILYLTHMFQSGLFFQLSRSATDLIRREIRRDQKVPTTLDKLMIWARDPSNGFSLTACEIMFYHIRLVYPDLTIIWCNVMMLLNNVDCNRDFWRNLLVYECHQCLAASELSHKMENLSVADVVVSDTSIDDSISCVLNKGLEEPTGFKRSTHINRPSSLNLSDVSFNDQLRRSFIKKIADSESRDKPFNRNIIETNDEDGQTREQEVNIGNTEQCLSPNIELTRRGALCLVLDFVSMSMSDVEHITWLIIHHINDIVRWSYETPVEEFISAVHGNSASSGIFIQAVNSNFNNLTSISFITRLLCTLGSVHYTQYGSLVVLLVEKLLSSSQLLPFRALAKRIEKFACDTVDKLLNETNKSLIATNDEVINQLTTEDLDRILSRLHDDLYPELTKILIELRKSSQEQFNSPTIEFYPVGYSDDEDSDDDEIETLYKKANSIYKLSEQGYSGHISVLIPALNTINCYLAKQSIIDRVNENESLVCTLVSSIYMLALSIEPPPTRLIKPKFWTSHMEGKKNGVTTEFSFDNQPTSRPALSLKVGSKRQIVEPVSIKKLSSCDGESNHHRKIEDARKACLEGLFLFDHMDCLRFSHYDCKELIIRLARLKLLNSFVLTPPSLWRSDYLPAFISDTDEYKIKFPMVPHDIISKDHIALNDFLIRLLKLGWTSRRQFEEAWMTLIGVLSATLSQSVITNFSEANEDKKSNLKASCKVIYTLTKFLLLSKRTKSGDPSALDVCYAQSFDDRVYDLTKAIGTNLSTLRKKTKSIFETIEFEKRSPSNSPEPTSSRKPKSQVSPKSIKLNGDDFVFSDFSHHLKISAQKLRMSSILLGELDSQDTVVIENEQANLQSDEVDIQSCIRLLLTIYEQKLKNPGVDILASNQDEQQTTENQQQFNTQLATNKKAPSQLAPPLATAICQSMLALSDLFANYEQFDFLFKIFVQMFELAEKNADDIQMQYLIVGLCKATAIRCYEVPNELSSSNDIIHRIDRFEKCRMLIERCLKSEFIPLKLNALYGIYYMLEDSINIVASGAWELDDFKLLRQSRLTWILRLMPILLDKENSKLLTRNMQTMKMLESLCETVPEFELRSLKV